MLRLTHLLWTKKKDYGIIRVHGAVSMANQGNGQFRGNNFAFIELD